MPGKAEVQPPPAEHRSVGNKHANMPGSMCKAMAALVAGHMPRAAEFARMATTTCLCPDALDDLLAASCAGMNKHSQLHLVRCSTCQRLLLAAAFHAHLPTCRWEAGPLLFGQITSSPCRRHT